MKSYFCPAPNSRSGDHAKELMLAQMKPDSMFMAGIGIQSLGYTFLLLQMYSELEVELMKNSSEQAALTSDMYKKMSQLEMKMADDIKSSGFAKGLSQITGAFANLGAAAYTFNEKRKMANEFQKNESKIEITAKKAKTNESAQASGSLNAEPSAPDNARAQASDDVSAPAPEREQTRKEKQALKRQERKDALDKKEREDKFHKDMEAAGSLASLLGRSLDQVIQGTGTIIASGYDADKQAQEGLKHLVQMIMGNADTQKSRLQQQYEEAAKKMEDAIQAYNAAMNASH